MSDHSKSPEVRAEKTEPGGFGSDALHRLIDVLTETAQRDATLRAALRRAGQWLLEIGAETPAPAEATEGASKADNVPETPDTAPAPMPLRLGNAQAVVPVRGEQGETPVSATRIPLPDEPIIAPPPQPSRDLAMVKRRTALKAESCRWAIERRGRQADGADFDTWIKPRDHELVSAAKELPNCYVWPLDPYVTLPTDESLERAALCYGNLHRAADFALTVHDADPDSEVLEVAYAMLAEAQSAVRALMRQLELKEDTDQNDTFYWLRERTEEDKVYVERFMKVNDLADPGRAEELEEELAQARESWEAKRRASAARGRLFNKARYHVRRLVKNDALDAEHDWQVLIEVVSELVGSGLPPSNAELREMLLPIVDQLPDEMGNGPEFQRVLREVDRYLATRELDRPPQAPEPQDENVLRVRELLRGKTLVLIGGERRGETADRLRRIFELKDLHWVSTREHQSTAEFEAPIARPETALVVLAIRWASHSFEDVAEMAARHNKAFVRLPRGYGANQIAHQVLQQASEMLAAKR